MTTNLPLDKMSIKDKLEAMESLWQDLSANAREMLSPDWHESILQGREAAGQQGKDDFIDFDEVKMDINKHLK